MRIPPLISTNVNTWNGTEHTDPPAPNLARVLDHTGGSRPVAPQFTIQHDQFAVPHAPFLPQLTDYIDQIYGA